MEEVLKAYAEENGIEYDTPNCRVKPQPIGFATIAKNRKLAKAWAAWKKENEQQLKLELDELQS